MSPDRVLQIPKIENGFVIDHIPTGVGARILELLRRHPEFDRVVITVGLNFSSRRLQRKDLIKIQAPALPPAFRQHLSLVAPGVTIKQIEKHKVVGKLVLEPPELVDNLLTCPNPNCITAHEREVETSFHLVRREPLTFRCNYCERHFPLGELTASLRLR